MRVSSRLLKVYGPLILLTFPAGAADGHPFIQDLNNIKIVASTVPGNGDVNPYGVAIVPTTTGALEAQSILVSNFNNSKNLQGTGTTIDEISPAGNVKVFATLHSNSLPGPCPGGVGLTTALVALRSGFVIVGSLPTSDGTAATAEAGCLIILDRNGTAVATLSGNGINGPWDMTSVDLGGAAVLFVTNVLNGTVAGKGNVVNGGTVLRIVLLTPPFGAPRELARTVIASGFPEVTDPNALVIGPTGLGFLGDGRLFVADTLGNRIAAISDALFRTNNAGTGVTISQGGALNGPLGLAIAPNGDILTVNSGDGNMVEVTPGGQQAAVKAVDVSHQGAGTLFGLAIAPNGHGVYFVDDGNNTLNLLH
ncbi:NHL repeat protein [Candidatus Sulfopaludibacter sp. SbA6]|nr:NHL repeat protein [Candidatus Sulfopaludibacter sp. SbA6]